MVVSQVESNVDASVRAVSPRSECGGGVARDDRVSVVVDWSIWEGAFALARGPSNAACIRPMTHISLEVWQYFVRTRPADMLF
jgi:hypothetical protein